MKFLQQRLSILNVFEFVTCLVLIPSALALGERLYWFLELLAHFRLQYVIAAFSTVPLTVISTAPLADERITTLRFKLENRNLGEITVTAMHPVPPVTPTSAKARNNEIKAVSEWIAKQDGKQILLGDLNLTPYSYVFRDMVKETGLQPVRSALGTPTTTWPSFTLAGIFRIPIDHVLVSDDLQFTTSGWHKEFGHGSDHALLRIELEPGPHASLF